MKKADREKIDTMKRHIEGIFDMATIEKSWRNDLFDKCFALSRENADLKARLEVYDKFFDLFDTTNPDISDPNKIVMMYNGELYSTEKWNIEATDVNDKTIVTEKLLHITLRCIDR